MEEAYRIFDYLPLSYKTETEQEYITFLWETFENNYEQGKYQFAFLAYHMLFMSFVYFIIWQIKTNKKEDFDKALVAFQNETERDFLNATSPFVFHKVNESVIFRFLKLIGCSKQEIGNYVKVVRYRNDIAHSCGNIFLNAQNTMDEKITLILRYIDEIQDYSKTIIQNSFEDFLISSSNIDEREYSEDTDQIREILIHKNYLSSKDVTICSEYDITQLNTHTEYSKIETMFNIFQNEYSELEIL
ncbi:MAG: hypothetical protein V3V16_15850 [Melioribacteraceae bacterium]